MSIMTGLSRFAKQWRRHRARRRTEALIASLPQDLQRDIGWPAVELYVTGRTRFLNKRA